MVAVMQEIANITGVWPLGESLYMCHLFCATVVINPRRACARVTVVILCVCLFVCLSVCLSVPALAASASVETSNQRYPLDFDSWIFEKKSRSKVMA